MIKTFKCKQTAKIFEMDVSLNLPREIQQCAYEKLRMLHNATILNDLKISPSNHLEKLTDDRAGQYSIRINKQWCLCFNWQDNDAYNVEITDYH